MNYCGTGKSFDPVITTLDITAGNQVRQRFEGLLSAEHYLQVVNGTPGLKRLEVNLNGRVFQVNGLSNGQSLSADLGRAMHEGEDNGVMLAGYGDVGASALVMITDMAGSDTVNLEEVVKLSFSQTAQGLKLAWADTLTGWQLLSAATPYGEWAEVATVPTGENGQLTVLVPSTGAPQFYRLHGPHAARSSTPDPNPAAASTTASVIPPTTSTLKRTYEGILW